jgi:hypothetical protein
MAAGLRTIILAGLLVGGIDGFALPDVNLADVESVRVRLAGLLGVNVEAARALSAIAITPRGSSNADARLTRISLARNANTGATGVTETRHADTGRTSVSEAPKAPLPEPREVLAPAAPVQIAMLTQPDLPHIDTREAPIGIKPPANESAPEATIDQYLWSLYQRAPKVDSVKVTEQKKAAVVEKGRLRTIIKNLVTVVREDFSWKDPKAAEKARMPMMDYVIGGMDRSFKLKLFQTLRAAETAGLSPGITSAFRDDYRQSIASGLKAADNRSYHGGSLRGGYGHGMAADIVSVNGANRAQRWTSTEILWKWIDAHGKDFGIARPYLDRDPPHVAPVDGKEYADHAPRGTKAQQARAQQSKTQQRRASARKSNRFAAHADHGTARRQSSIRSSKVRAT